jgi:hypothetical protein
MNKAIPKSAMDNDNDEILPEYDFSGGIRGKHFRDFQQGYTVTIHHADGSTTTKEYRPEPGIIHLEPDVQAYFPDSESVNKALRGLIALIPTNPS